MLCKRVTTTKRGVPGVFRKFEYCAHAMREPLQVFRRFQPLRCRCESANRGTWLALAIGAEASGEPMSLQVMAFRARAKERLTAGRT